MTAREQFVQCMESLLGLPVCWSMKGPDSYDCSGTVTACYKKVGGPDWRYTINAQGLHDKTRALRFGELPLGGDLAFFGYDAKRIVHVAVYTADGGVISADGATSHVVDPAEAAKNPANRVRRHSSVNYRTDTPYRVIHRNTLVDDLDHIER